MGRGKAQIGHSYPSTVSANPYRGWQDGTTHIEGCQVEGLWMHDDEDDEDEPTRH